MLRKLLQILGRWVVAGPRRVLLIYAVATVISLVATVLLLGFKTDQNDLVAADVEYNRRYLRLLADFEDIEYLYVVVQVKGEPEKAVRVSQAIVEEVTPLVAEGHIESIFHRVPLEELGHGLLFQKREAIARLSASIEANRDTLASLASADRFERLLRFFAESFDAEKLAAGTEQQDHEELAGWGFRLLDVTLGAIEGSLRGDEVRPVESEIERVAGLSLRERGYLVTEGDRFLLVELLPVKDTTSLELIREPLIAVRAALDRVRARFPDVEIGLTGRPVFQADEMMTTDSDMRRATIAALVGVFVLFVVFFRRLVRPLLAVSTLAVSIVLTFGVVSITIGYLTLLSIVFAAMLVGLGIDFGIHFVARYQEELAHGKDVPTAIQTTLETTGVGIGTGALTTAVAFFTTLLVDFAGLRELGFIAGVGVLLCFLGMVTFLPALLLLVDGRPGARHKLRNVSPPRVPGVDRAAGRPILAVSILAIITLVGLWRFDGPRYNSNLLDLQAKGLESVKYEMLLIEQSEKATWYAAFVAKSLDEVGTLVDRLQPHVDSGVLGSVESPLDVIPEDQPEKIQALAKGAAAVKDISLATPSSDVDVERLSASCEVLLGNLEDLQDVLLQRPEDDTESRKALREISALVDRCDVIIELLESEADTAGLKISSTQERWFGEMRALLAGRIRALRSGPIEIATLPPVLRNRLVSKDGKSYLVYAYPRKDIWDNENMQEFVDAMVAVDPEVTGTPVQVYESTWRMRDSFVKAGLYSLIAVFILLLIDLRSLSKALLTIIPLIVGIFWLVEALPYVGLEFNLANFFAVPILIGCGVDGGVHVVHRFKEARSAAEVGRTTCAAVTLSLATTMIGFGAMSFASHQGIASLGRMMVAGLLCLLVSTVVLLPSLLALTERRKK